jgi:hypothetical protein
MKSIISNEKECFICRTTYSLHKHHIFFGYGNRQISDEQGCWVYLCARHHNMSDEGVHFNTPFDIMLKKYCQEKWEEINGNREKFIKTFGKSYL